IAYIERDRSVPSIIYLPVRGPHEIIERGRGCAEPAIAAMRVEQRHHMVAARAALLDLPEHHAVAAHPDGADDAAGDPGRGAFQHGHAQAPAQPPASPREPSFGRHRRGEAAGEFLIGGGEDVYRETTRPDDRIMRLVGAI